MSQKAKAMFSKAFNELGLALCCMVALTITWMSFSKSLDAAEESLSLPDAVVAFLDRDDEAARKMLLELSEAGSIEALTLLGYLYSDPVFELRDDGQALTWFVKAAEQGSSEAMFQLSISDIWPNKTSNSSIPTRELTEHMIDAAERGHLGAILMLGLRCGYKSQNCQEFDVYDEKKNRLRFGHYRSLFRALQFTEFLEREEFSQLGELLPIGIQQGDPLIIHMALRVSDTVMDLRCDDENGPLIVGMYEVLVRNGMFLPITPSHKKYAECWEGNNDADIVANSWIIDQFDLRLDQFRACDGLSGERWYKCLSRSNWDHVANCGRYSLIPFLQGILGSGHEHYNIRETPRYLQCRKMALEFPNRL